MTATKSLYDLTATDLTSGVAVALRQWAPLREAADELLRAGGALDGRRRAGIN